MFLKNILPVIFIVGCAVGAQLPAGFKRCKRRDQKCLLEAIRDAIPKFNKGFKSLGVPGLDPLSIPRMEIPGGTGAVRISQKVYNGELYGLSGAILEKFLFDVDNGKAALTFLCPNLTLKANYEMTGQILVLPVNGKGKMNVRIENARGDEKIKLVVYKKDGKEYMKVDDTILKLEAGHVNFNMDNIFDGNKELSDQINQVMNENWNAVFDEIKEGYNDAIRRFVDNIVNTFFSQIPIDEAYLD